MAKISDFCLLNNILNNICADMGVNFVDVDIDFDLNEDLWYFENNKIKAPSSKVSNQSLNKTMFMVCMTYLKNIQSINGCFLSNDTMNNILSYIYYVIFDFTHSNIEDNEFDDFNSSIEIFPVSWMILKNIISPIYGINIKNIPIIFGKYHDKDVISFDKSNSNIYVNLGINSMPILEAYSLMACLKIFLPDNDKKDIIRSVFLDSFLKKRILSFASMTLKNMEDFMSFFATLSMLTNTEELSVISEIHASSDNMKLSQASPLGVWWHQGLIEKMLEPARGSDFAVTKSWKEITDAFKKKVEKERKLRGLVDVPFEILLRLNSDDLSNEDKVSIQKKLDEARIW